MEFSLAKKEDIEEISHFIGSFNIKKENHIGYCGTNKEEIQSSLINDITDVPFYESFIIGRENEKIIGVLGFDVDIERNSAEIWGPFISKESWDIALNMWNEMIKLLPKDTKFISMFINKENKNCMSLAKKLSFNKVSEECILNFKRKDIGNLEELPIVELELDKYEEMQILHDKTFPKAYYTGEEIIERLNHNRKVFIYTKNEMLVGYIYVEVDPEFDEGNIEFFAVSEVERGQGIGVKLLTMALKWIFSYKSINSITLCVGAGNNIALNLYEKIGFQHQHQLYYYTKRL